MQLYNVYTIFDNKALIFMPPFTLTSDAVAIRAFGNIVNDPSTNVARNPGDYSLYCVGTFLDTKGLIETISPIRHVSDATALLAIHQNHADGAPIPSAGAAASITDLLNGKAQ